MKYRSLILIFICLSLVLRVNAQSSDPFSVLFGDAEVKTSQTDDASDDNISILRLKLRSRLLDDNWISYQTPDGLCIPIIPFSEALELPLREEDGLLKGFVLNPDKPITLDPANNPEFTRSEDGWCISIYGLENIYPLNIDYRPSRLELIVTPLVVLPLDDKLAREELRSQLRKKTSADKVFFRLVDNPRRPFSFPTLDLVLNSRLSNGGNSEYNASITGAADIFWMSTFFQSNVDKSDTFSDSRIRFFRDNNRPEELSFLKARRFAFGDISSIGQPLIARAESGSGVVVSNQPSYAPDLFDETTVRGPLPEGWEAELFEGDTLIAFKVESDGNGEYVFENVPLRPGYNYLTVRLYGPYGEQSERLITKFVGPEHRPKRELRYSFGYVNSARSFLGETDEETDLIVIDADPPSKTGFLSLEYGLSQNYTLRGDISVRSEQSLVSASLIASLFGGYAVGRLAFDEAGNYGWEVNYQKRLSPQTSFTTRVTHFGALETPLNNAKTNRIRTQISGRLDTNIKFRGTLLPLQTQFNFNDRENGATDMTINTRTFGPFRGLRWNNALRYNLSSNEGVTSRSLQGELLASYLLAGVRLRSSVSYTLLDNFSINSVSLSARKRFNAFSQIQGDLSYDLSTKSTSFNTAYTRSFNALALQAQASISDSGDWRIGAGVSFALYNDELENEYKLSRPGISQSGVIAPRIFDDLNNNGFFDEDDIPLKGAQFIIENSLRSDESNASGINIIAGLSPTKTVNAEIKISSIEDPFLRPIEIGRTFELRPGQVLQYEVPLTATGEIEGTLTVDNGLAPYPVAGIILLAVNKEGQIIGRSRTEYDGYFYLEGIPATDLTLQVSDETLEALQGQFKPVPIGLSRENPSLIGIELSIKTFD